MLAVSFYKFLFFFHSLIFLSILVQSCSLAPRYERNTGVLPTEWRVATDAKYANSDIQFWKQLEDPVLNGLIDEALKYNQDLQVAIYTVKEFEAKYGIASAELYPQFNGSGDAGRTKVSGNFFTTPPGSQTTSNFYELLLNASYLVDIWGKIRNTSKSAYAEMLAQVEVRRTVVISVVTGVIHTYIQMRMFDEQLKISIETRDTRLESLKLATVRFDLGLTSLMQVEQAKSEVEEAQVQVDQFKIQIALQEDLLSLLLGKPSFTPPRGKTITELLLPSFLPSYVPSTIIDQRPDILQAEQELISANANIGVARARFFPEFNLVGNYGAQSSGLSNFFTNSSNIWQYGATLLQEIFTGFRLTSQLKLANATKSAMLHNYQQTILNGLREINDALISHTISKDLTAEQKARVATLKSYFELAGDQYVEGLTDYLTYLDAERKYFQAELDYAGALAYALNTFVNIYQASGGGWVLDSDSQLIIDNK